MRAFHAWLDISAVAEGEIVKMHTMMHGATSADASQVLSKLLFLHEPKQWYRIHIMHKAR
jgi:hypothetical protein